MLYDDPVVPLSGPRIFSLFARKGLWFGNEHGHQAWLTEPRPPGAAVNFLKVLDAKAARAVGKSPVPSRPKSAVKRRRK